jgi:hypothetical protein
MAFAGCKGLTWHVGSACGETAAPLERGEPGPYEAFFCFRGTGVGCRGELC